MGIRTSRWSLPQGLLPALTWNCGPLPFFYVRVDLKDLGVRSQHMHPKRVLGESFRRG